MYLLSIYYISENKQYKAFLLNYDVIISSSLQIILECIMDIFLCSVVWSAAQHGGAIRCHLWHYEVPSDTTLVPRGTTLVLLVPSSVPRLHQGSTMVVPHGTTVLLRGAM